MAQAKATIALQRQGEQSSSRRRKPIVKALDISRTQRKHVPNGSFNAPRSSHMSQNF